MVKKLFLCAIFGILSINSFPTKNLNKIKLNLDRQAPSEEEILKAKLNDIQYRRVLLNTRFFTPAFENKLSEIKSQLALLKIDIQDKFDAYKNNENYITLIDNLKKLAKNHDNNTQISLSATLNRELAVALTGFIANTSKDINENLRNMNKDMKSTFAEFASLAIALLEDVRHEAITIINKKYEQEEQKLRDKLEEIRTQKLADPEQKIDNQKN